MQTIDLIHKKGCKVIEFPDGELHLVLDELNRKEEVCINCRICNGNDLFLLMQLSDILNRQCVVVSEMYIYYIMGMRCDRLFDINRPFTLRIVTEVINSFHADNVFVYEGHSDRLRREIKCFIHKSKTYGMAYGFHKSGFVLVAPDAGATKRYPFDMGVVCSKKRDEATGELLGFEANPVQDVAGKDLLVIDDLCDGGGTFVGLAPKLRELNPKSLSLCVTHAVQKKGIEKVAAVYDNVYITDTYKDWAAEDLPANVEVYKVTH